MTNQILALLEADKERSLEPAVTHPVWAYTDPKFFELEKKKLFGGQPLLAGLSCDIPKPGDFLTRDDLGIPTIITRDNDGKAHALLNICTHRAARLKEGFGNARSLSCPYHAWNFGLDGTLRKVFKQDSFGSIEKCEYDLDKISCEEKYGMIFICFDSGNQLDIDNHLGNMALSLDIWEFNELRFIREREWKIDKNWKLSLDTLCDGYCFDIQQAIPENNIRLRQAVGYDQLGPMKQHHRMTFPNNNIFKLKDLDDQEWGEKAIDSFKLLHFVFPNVVLAISESTVEFLSVYPGESNDEHILRLRTYVRLDEDGLVEESKANLHFDQICEALDTAVERFMRDVELKTRLSESQSILSPSSQEARANILDGIFDTLDVDPEQKNH
tara:strand:+ start:1213 stop:2364 length:1152 start_codon:yes stop_codon:yes gene_type:complete